MKHFLYITLILLTTAACQQQTLDTQKLNGYWEIKKVTFEDGTEKKFTVNKVVDFIEVDGTTGKRSKVAPKLDGTFVTNKDVDALTIQEKDGKTFLIYKTPYHSWEEQLLEVKDSSFVIKNEEDKVYEYKRFVPFNFN